MASRIYQFNVDGKLINQWDSPKKAHVALGIHRVRISAICRAMTLVNKEYYLSYNPTEVRPVYSENYKERLAKRSHLESPFTIGDLERMKQYKDNLMVVFTMHYNDMNDAQRRGVLKEIGQLIKTVNI